VPNRDAVQVEGPPAATLSALAVLTANIAFMLIGGTVALAAQRGMSSP
jgi:hypothetical protein